MNDLRLYLLYDRADDGWSVELKNGLRAEFTARLDPESIPEIELRLGFDNMLDLNLIGPLSLVLVVLPEPTRGFTESEQRKIAAFRQAFSNDDLRLVPIASDPARNSPPRPIDDLVSFKLHDSTNPNLIKQLATLLLNLLCLRVSSAGRSVFISYKISDGKLWAEGIAKGLKDRGYTVWRDEDIDRDGQFQIGVGSPAQKTIQKAILQHGFVLVIDTLEAPRSSWVDEEISTAISYLLPVMPAIIEDADEDRPPKIGGRFRSLRELQHEVRLTSKGINAASQATGSKVDALDRAFFDGLEAAMSQYLLEHLRSRRKLMVEARRRFEALRFGWKAVSENHLLYEAINDRDSERTPGLFLRFLIQCAPYDVLLENTISNLCAHYHQIAKPYQYCVLVHQTALYAPDKRRLLNNCQGYVMLLQPDEINHIPSVFQFQKGGVP
jgi:hypothetical protein